MLQTITLQLPEMLYRRLEQTARATQRPLDEVVLHALEAGSPPFWEDAPEEFQSDLAAMDRMDDAALWQIAQSRRSPAELARYDELLARAQSNSLTAAEQIELRDLRDDADRFVLRKAHAAAVLRWRGHTPVMA